MLKNTSKIFDLDCLQRDIVHCNLNKNQNNCDYDFATFTCGGGVKYTFYTWVYIMSFCDLDVIAFFFLVLYRLMHISFHVFGDLCCFGEHFGIQWCGKRDVT